MTVKIRAFRMSDLDDVLELRTMPRSQRETLQLPFISYEVLKKRYEALKPTDHSLVAVLEETQKVVGNIGLIQATNLRRAHTAYIGMSVHDAYHNQGIGTMLMDAVIDLADNWLNLKRLELEVFVDNKPAIHLYEKYGFEIEGTLRKYAFRDGRFIDAYAMARLRD